MRGFSTTSGQEHRVGFVPSSSSPVRWGRCEEIPSCVAVPTPKHCPDYGSRVPHTPGFPVGLVESRPWVVPRTGIRVSDPFFVRCEIPPRSTRHLFAFVDTPSLDASLGRTFEVRGIPHLAQGARSDMGHPRPVVGTVFPEWDRKGFFTPSSGWICSFTLGRNIVASEPASPPAE